MSDQLPPRPQYGEYATPEEQRARIRQPDVTAALETGQAPKSPAAIPTLSKAQPAERAAEPRLRPYDRIITFALLAIGLVDVARSFPALVDYPAYTDTLLGILGDFIGVNLEMSDPAAGRPWGIAAALVLAGGWAITALLSWWSLRRGRLTWWIPVVGAIVFVTLSSLLAMIPLLSDPAVRDALVGFVP